MIGLLIRAALKRHLLTQRRLDQHAAAIAELQADVLELEGLVRDLLLGDAPAKARETSEGYRETAGKLESVAEYASALHRRVDKLQGIVERALIEGPSVPDGCERVLSSDLRCKACRMPVPYSGEHNCAAIPASPLSAAAEALRAKAHAEKAAYEARRCEHPASGLRTSSGGTRCAFCGKHWPVGGAA